MSKIVVVHIITRLELGGAQQNTLYTVSHLDPEKFIPYLIAGEGGILDREAALINHQVRFVPELQREVRPGRDLIALVKIYRLLREIRHRHGGSPMVVHTHSSKAGILGRLAARLAGIRQVVHTFHGFGFHDFQNPWIKSIYIFLEKWIGKITTEFIFVSKDNQERARRLGIARSDSLLIRSGISFNSYRSVSREGSVMKSELGIRETDRLITMVACLKPQKAPMDFVRMAGEVAKHFPEARFILVGDGELREEIVSEISRLNLNPVVQLTGWRRDIPAILSATDIFVLSSLWEGLPRVLIEAKLSGLPVVTTDIEGSQEILENGISGFIVPRKDYVALAEKVLYLLKNPSIAREMGKSGSPPPVDFDIDFMVKSQETVYTNMVLE